MSRVSHRTGTRVPENLPLDHLSDSWLGLHLDDVARDVNNLGDLVGARAAFERALGILQGFLPEGHPYIGIVRGNRVDRVG